MRETVDLAALRRRVARRRSSWTDRLPQTGRRSVTAFTGLIEGVRMEESNSQLVGRLGKSRVFPLDGWEIVRIV
jgi:hypothetical protein